MSSLPQSNRLDQSIFLRPHWYFIPPQWFAAHEYGWCHLRYKLPSLGRKLQLKYYIKCDVSTDQTLRNHTQLVCDLFSGCLQFDLPVIPVAPNHTEQISRHLLFTTIYTITASTMKWPVQEPYCLMLLYFQPRRHSSVSPQSFIWKSSEQCRIGTSHPAEGDSPADMALVLVHDRFPQSSFTKCYIEDTY